MFRWVARKWGYKVAAVVAGILSVIITMFMFSRPWLRELGSPLLATLIALLPFFAIIALSFDTISSHVGRVETPTKKRNKT